MPASSALLELSQAGWGYSLLTGFVFRGQAHTVVSVWHHLHPVRESLLEIIPQAPRFRSDGYKP